MLQARMKSFYAQGRPVTTLAIRSMVLTGKRSTVSLSPKPKRQKFIPTPLSSLNSPSVKSESTSSLQSTSPVRYSLRRRSKQAVKEEGNDIKGEDLTLEPIPPPQVQRSRTPSVKSNPFSISPRKASVKPIKVDLDPAEARTAPKRWREQYELLVKQRRRIVAPVDTMGCQENGKDEKRQDSRSQTETAEERARRERFTILISLMLSSQTKDPVTAEAVHNLQRNLPGGLSLSSVLNASADDIARNINKVGFWRRKTGYIQSAAAIIQRDFGGDIPKTIDELCSLPGVGPKMGFLALQGAWGT